MNTDYFKNFSYSLLNHLQVGRVCEYWVKMFFTLENLDTYTSEVDDKGIDFIVRLDNSIHIDIQVKAVRLKTSAYVFITKKNWPEEYLRRTNLYLALVLLKDGFAPDVYLIPASAWLKPNELLCSRDYGKDGQTSLPEWGVNISIKNYSLLEQYSLPKQVALIQTSNAANPS
jgi:hypothetical protein